MSSPPPPSLPLLRLLFFVLIVFLQHVCFPALYRLEPLLRPVVLPALSPCRLSAAVALTWLGRVFRPVRGPILAARLLIRCAAPAARVPARIVDRFSLPPASRMGVSFPLVGAQASDVLSAAPSRRRPDPRHPPDPCLPFLLFFPPRGDRRCLRAKPASPSP